MHRDLIPIRASWGSFGSSPHIHVLRDQTSAQFNHRNVFLLFDLQILEKQKAELLALIKKQMKLIDVLKKQKIHLESSSLIHFQQDELTKYINFGVPAKPVG